MAKKTLTLETLPHKEWLVEEADWLAEHKIDKSQFPDEIKKAIKGAETNFNIHYKRDPERHYDTVMNASLIAADMLQSWKEKDYEDAADDNIIIDPAQQLQHDPPAPVTDPKTPVVEKKSGFWGYLLGGIVLLTGAIVGINIYNNQQGKK
jgi:hypothetical protein